ncbi:metal-sensitive transcriptional regulator [Paludifilum halophilum]|uniref:Cytoplasmic protein n=1 Tax=Paludifilum halophilum TaxID=1642702 RepID=A0A235B713_9BACL|nr:metal-sensitive transcriptional regulator [Paludifilum halophilum]OYD08086.1 cytoplasmic protein [Paludifilum halophilum]
MQYSDDMKRRLRRIEGQIGGVLRMMDQEKPCKDVVSQLSAIRSAIDRATAYTVSRHLEQCIREELESDQAGDTEKLVQEAINLLVKSR